MAGSLLLTGCRGKSLVDDNPVFAAAPPRRQLTNRSTVAATDDASGSSAVRTVSFAKLEEHPLTGNTIVAEVNGAPIFVDDIAGSVRLAIEGNPAIPDDQRQKLLYQQVKARLTNYVDQEIVIQALEQAIPADRRSQINESLEGPFQEVITNIKRDRNLTTDAELNDVLANEGLSVDLLRESFFRIQKVQGYLSTIADAPSVIDRSEMVAWYQAHLDEFTTHERVRWQEIVVKFDHHGGRKGAEQRMADVVRQLQAGADFAELAASHSDALSAEKRGDMGWLERGSLADTDLEQQLFALESGQMTKVYVRDTQFEVYRVVDHQHAKTSEFQEVQRAIEQKIKAERQQAARKEALDKLKAKAIVVTMFDDDDAVDQ
ncbi:MAG: peptidylprolyl isomerase [Planctomycetaceae bacterium]